MTANAWLMFSVFCLFIYLIAVSYPIIEKQETFALMVVGAAVVILCLALFLE